MTQQADGPTKQSRALEALNGYVFTCHPDVEATHEGYGNAFELVTNGSGVRLCLFDETLMGATDNGSKITIQSLGEETVWQLYSGDLALWELYAVLPRGAYRLVVG